MRSTAAAIAGSSAKSDNVVRSEEHNPNRIGTSSESNEWFTPPALISVVRQVLDGPIDLDPASCAVANRTVQAARYYSIAENGLKQHHKARRVFVNPPGGKTESGASNTGIWFDHTVGKVRGGEWGAAVFLIFNCATASAWFRSVWNHPIAFFYRRVKYLRPDGTPGAQPPPNNGALVLIASPTDLEARARFRRACAPVARVVMPASGGVSQGEGAALAEVEDRELASVVVGEQGSMFAPPPARPGEVER